MTTTTTTNDERRAAPPGAFRNAHLVTSYFALESYALPVDWKRRWARPSKSGRLRKLRQRLAEVRAKLGLVEQPLYFERVPPVIAGPLPVPVPRPRRQPTPPPSRPLPVVVKCAAMQDGHYVPGSHWYFRTELARRAAERPTWERWPERGLIAP